MIMKAFEARLANRQTPHLRWLTHPYPELEVQRLEMCKQLIQTAQALMEPPPVEPKDKMVQPSPTEIMLKTSVPNEDEQEGHKEDLKVGDKRREDCSEHD